MASNGNSSANFQGSLTLGGIIPSLGASLQGVSQSILSVTDLQAKAEGEKSVLAQQVSAYETLRTQANSALSAADTMLKTATDTLAAANALVTALSGILTAAGVNLITFEGIQGDFGNLVQEELNAHSSGESLVYGVVLVANEGGAVSALKKLTAAVPMPTTTTTEATTTTEQSA